MSKSVEPFFDSAAILPQKTAKRSTLPRFGIIQAALRGEYRANTPDGSSAHLGKQRQHGSTRFFHRVGRD